MRRVLFVAAIVALLDGARPARGQPVDPLAAFADEPSVTELQHAAERHADLEPERVASLLSRVRTAALAPAVSVRVGRGARLLSTSNTVDGAVKYVVDDGTSWYFDLGASWSLDRLVFDREEVRLAHVALGIERRREELLTTVARLYFERRRIALGLALHPPADAMGIATARLRIDELGAILDGLTGDALSRARTRPAPAATEDPDG